MSTYIWALLGDLAQMGIDMMKAITLFFGISVWQIFLFVVIAAVVTWIIASLTGHKLEGDDE